MKKYVRLTKLSNIIERIEKGILGIYHVQKLEDLSCKDINFTNFQKFSGKLFLLMRKRKVEGLTLLKIMIYFKNPVIKSIWLSLSFSN